MFFPWHKKELHYFCKRIIVTVIIFTDIIFAICTYFHEIYVVKSTVTLFETQEIIAFSILLFSEKPVEHISNEAEIISYYSCAICVEAIFPK